MVESRAQKVQKATEMYLAGLSVPRAAAACGISKHAVYQWLKFTNQLGARPNLIRGPRMADPSEAEIAERAAAIRAGWTDNERATRWVASGRPSLRLERMYGCLRRAYAKRAS